jgi:hypothetical protein
MGLRGRRDICSQFGVRNTVGVATNLIRRCFLSGLENIFFSFIDQKKLLELSFVFSFLHNMGKANRGKRKQPLQSAKRPGSGKFKRNRGSTLHLQHFDDIATESYTPLDYYDDLLRK